MYKPKPRSVRTMAGEVLKNSARSPRDAHDCFTRFVFVSGEENGKLPSNLSDYRQEVSLSFKTNFLSNNMNNGLLSTSVNYSCLKFNVICELHGKGCPENTRLFSQNTLQLCQVYFTSKLIRKLGLQLQHGDLVVRTDAVKSF